MRSHGARILGTLALVAGVATAMWTVARGGDGAAAGSGPESAPARRVVSLIPAATEILFAIGAGDRLVGRTRWGLHPPEAAAVPDVGDGIRPSLEAVLAREPDLVVLVAGSDNRGVAERLGALGVRTLALTHNTLGDLERNVLALGAAVGCGGSAERLVRRIRDDLERLAASRPGPPVRVYYDVWSEPPMTIGRGSYLDSLLTLAGAENVFGGLAPPSPQVSIESIVRADPDLVLYSGAGGAEGPVGRPRWEHVPAVARGRVARIDGDLVGRLGPRVAEAARELARAVHGSDAERRTSGGTAEPVRLPCAP